MNVKDKIKLASLDLLIENGIHGTSTKMITERAGVSNGALFHHFANKDEILMALYVDIKRELMDALYEEFSKATSVRKFMYNHFRSNILWSLENPKKKLFLEMYSNMPVIRNCSDYLDQEKVDYMSNFYQEAITNEEIIVFNYESFLLNLLGSIDAATRYLEFSTNEDKDQFIEFAFKQFWRSVVNF